MRLRVAAGGCSWLLVATGGYLCHLCDERECSMIGTIVSGPLCFAPQISSHACRDVRQQQVFSA